MTGATISTELRNTWTDDPITVPCTIEYGENSIAIRPAGYGDAGSQDGYGCPVVIEYYDHDVRVLVWADINNQDPTHVISLAGALESKRLDTHPED